MNLDVAAGERVMDTKDLTIDLVRVGKDDFEMWEDGAKITQLTFDKDVDKIHGKKMKKADKYLVHLKIDPRFGLKFEPDVDEAMWIKKGSSSSAPPCFTTKHNEGTDEFTVTRASDYQLDVANLDKNKCDFRFVLNFVDGAGQKEQYDPIMSNRNGGT